MSTNEVRTVSSTGGAKGVKPERFSLMPRAGLAAIARVFGFGAEKYDAHNWRKGYEWSKSFDALERHIQSAKDGETYDEESGLPHLAHAGFHVLVLLTWLEEQGEGVENLFDDRWPAAMERLRLAQEAEEAKPDLDRMWVIPNAEATFGTFDDTGLTIEFEAKSVPTDTMLLLFGQADIQAARFVVGETIEDLQEYHNRG